MKAPEARNINISAGTGKLEIQKMKRSCRNSEWKTECRNCFHPSIPSIRRTPSFQNTESWQYKIIQKKRNLPQSGDPVCYWLSGQSRKAVIRFVMLAAWRTVVRFIMLAAWRTVVRFIMLAAWAENRKHSCSTRLRNL